MVSFFTFCARIWLFTRMDSFMWMFMLGLAETFSTMGATEGLLSCMSSLMYLQESFMRKCFFAFAALKRSFTCVLLCIVMSQLRSEYLASRKTWDNSCKEKFAFHLNAIRGVALVFPIDNIWILNWHIVHENYFSSMWTQRCGRSDDAWTKDFSQTVHSNDLICACVFWWDFTWAESTNLSSHEE